MLNWLARHLPNLPGLIRVKRRAWLEHVQSLENDSYHVEPRLVDYLTVATHIRSGTLSQRKFMELVFIAHDKSRVLTPNGGRRQLRDVASRMKENGWTFDRLASNPPIVAGNHQPDWFKKCPEIYNDFDHRKLHYFLISDCNRDEDGSYYLSDGVHKGLVYAYRILFDNEPYRRVKLIYTRPRR